MEEQTIAIGGVQYVPHIVDIQQIIYLDFDGEFTSYNGELLAVENVEVKPSALSEERISSIVTALNEQYAFQGVLFVTEKPQFTDFSAIFIGKTSCFNQYGSFSGLAETIDEGNLNKTDRAFVMLDAANSDSEIISTISHEANHLLGTLNHGGDGLAAYAENSVINAGTSSSGLVVSHSHSASIYSGGILLDTELQTGGCLYVY